MWSWAGPSWQVPQRALYSAAPLGSAAKHAEEASRAIRIRRLGMETPDLRLNVSQIGRYRMLHTVSHTVTYVKRKSYPFCEDPDARFAEVFTVSMPWMFGR